jgi:hypothetical protein
MKNIVLIFISFLIFSCGSTSERSSYVKKTNEKIEKRQDKEKWKMGTFISTDTEMRCTALVHNKVFDYLAVSFKKDKRNFRSNITIQVKTSIPIENDGTVTADFSFYKRNKTKHSVDIRTKMVSYLGKDNLFYLNSNNTTLDTFVSILDYIKEYQTVKIDIFDNKWIEHNYKFSLVESSNVVKEVGNKCL